MFKALGIVKGDQSVPTRQEVQNIRELLSGSLCLLCQNDTDLVDLGDSEVIEYALDVGKYERKLHEVCINHRFAHYI